MTKTLLFIVLVASAVRSAVAGLVPVGTLGDRHWCLKIFSHIAYVPENQYHYLGVYEEVAKRAMARTEVASHSLYEYTRQFPQRLTEWDPKMLSLLKELTGWELPLGVSYSVARDETTVVALGDPGRVRRVEALFYDRPTASVPHQSILLENDGDPASFLWVGKARGNLEGSWYDFRYTATQRAARNKQEPVPPVYFVADPLAHKVAHERAQVWFPPLPSGRSPCPAPNISNNEPANGQGRKAEVILELDLDDLAPPDCPASFFGSASIFRHSRLVQALTEPFTAVELMPVRHSAFFDTRSSHPDERSQERDLFYVHYWGYMPRSWALSNGNGGPDAVFEGIDALHARGIKVYKDEVLQHLANPQGHVDGFLALYHFALADTFTNRDITGCGNTTNLCPDSTITKIAFQGLIQDLMIDKFDGYREDLMGAIPKPSAEALTKATLRLGKDMSGEPYGYGQSEWDLSHPIRHAGLWDWQYKNTIRELVKYGGSWERLVSALSGGHPWTWVRESSDRTAIVETHDGDTMAHYLNNNFRKLGQAFATHMAAQGSVLVASTQLVAYDHPYLDNTPVDLFRLRPVQVQFRDYALKVVATRKKYNAYFSFPWLEDNANVRYLRTANSGAVGLWFPRPAYGPQSDEILILFNLSEQPVDFEIPPGEWLTMIDSANLKADPEGGLYPPATDRRYRVSGSKTVWLVKK